MRRNAFPTIQSQIDYVKYSYLARVKFKKEVNMTKKEQLKQVFMRELNKLIEYHGNVLIGKIVPVKEIINDTVNELLKEVSIRTKI